MSPEEIAELRRLYEEATQGKWRRLYDGIWCNESEHKGIGYGFWRAEDIELICAMHKHLPELLAAAEETLRPFVPNEDDS